MCGRYVMARAVGDLVAELEAEADEAMELRQSWNVAPTSDVPIVLERLVDGERARQLHVAKWGLVPAWAKDPSVGARSFNARSETIVEKPSFRKAVKTRRCAVPAEGYFEWRKSGEGKSLSKQPYFVRPADGSLILFAGVYEWWKDPSKEDGSPGQWLLSTSILTVPSPEPGSGDPVLEELATLHDRLPLPLDRDALSDWLDPRDTDATSLVAWARDGAFPVASKWELREVDPAVGNVRNDRPDLLDPVQAAEPVAGLF